MPPLLQALCRRLTRWGVLPAAKEPDSAIVNVYEEVGWCCVLKFCVVFKHLSKVHGA